MAEISDGRIANLVLEWVHQDLHGVFEGDTARLLAHATEDNNSLRKMLLEVL